MVDFVSVMSSNVEKVGYDTQGEQLYVQFKGGSLYEYQGVPLTVYTALLEAESKGKFLNKYMKSVYPYQKVGGKSNEKATDGIGSPGNSSGAQNDSV